MIVSRETADLDQDGFIDAVWLEFSESISDSSVSTGYFTISGASGLSFSSTTGGDTANDADIYISFNDGTLATDSTPNITYTLLGSGVQDTSGNSMSDDGPTLSSDTSSPVLLSAYSSVGSTTLTLIFSEPVYTTTGGAGNLLLADFSYTDVSGSGAASLTGTIDTDGSDEQAQLSVNTNFIAGDFDQDTIGITVNGIYDASDNSALTIRPASKLVPSYTSSRLVSAMSSKPTPGPSGRSQ